MEKSLNRSSAPIRDAEHASFKRAVEVLRGLDITPKPGQLVGMVRDGEYTVVRWPTPKAVSVESAKQGDNG